jgi:hypothetical protein
MVAVPSFASPGRRRALAYYNGKAKDDSDNFVFHNWQTAMEEGLEF